MAGRPALGPAELREIITSTGRLEDGFLVLDAEAAVSAAAGP